MDTPDCVIFGRSLGLLANKILILIAMNVPTQDSARSTFKMKGADLKLLLRI